MMSSDFETMFREPELWRDEASGHLYVADILLATLTRLRDWSGTGSPAVDHRRQAIALFRGVMNHRAMALELAAKGTIAESKELTPSQFNHKLFPLCEAAGIRLDARERDLVKRLESALMSGWGRYPVAKSNESHEASIPLRRLDPQDRSTLEAILGRLKVRPLLFRDHERSPARGRD